MQKPIILGLGFTVLPVLVASCSRSDKQVQSRAPHGRAALPQPVPSVKQAIIKAIKVSKGQRLFTQPAKGTNPDPKNPIVTVVYQPVEILGTRQPAGSVKVVFSRPISDVIVANGRMSTRKLFEVVVSRAGMASTSFVKLPASSSLSRDRVDKSLDKQEEEFGRAISVVCSRLQGDDHIEFAIGILTTKAYSYEGMSVSVDSIPYMPGGDTTYILSKDFKIVRILPGM